MRSSIVLTMLVLLCTLACEGTAEAQLFGEREGRRTESRRPSRPAREFRGSSRSSDDSGGASREAPRMLRPMEGVGTFDENARYIRGNRDATDFVGTDSGDVAGFVGAQQAGADVEVKSAVSDLQIETAPDANRTAPRAAPPRTRLYAPRLKVGFDVPVVPRGEVSSALLRRLESTLSLDDSSSIEVSVEGDTAVLRGVVSSERNRRLAGLLARFEPGISQVQNELEVWGPGPAPYRDSAPSGPPNDLR